MDPWLLLLLLALPPWAMAQDATTACRADPFAGRGLYLRGGFNNWSAAEEQRFVWACNRYELIVQIEGEHSFKIGDDAWSTDADFGRGKDGGLVLRGPNIVQRFRGQPERLLLTMDANRQAQRLAFEAFAGPMPQQNAEPAVTDAVALSLQFDSRSLMHKSPFGAVTAGSELQFAVTAKPGVEQIDLVVETRLLEGNQDRLVYTAVARQPMQRKSAAEGDRWEASLRLDAIAVYGYWFEARIAGQTYALQNNRDNVPWTREKGSGGVGIVALMPAEVKAIRRFRQTVYDPAFKVPAWAADVVYYQIFPDRFRNGDKRNDPQPGRDRHLDHGVEFHENWLDRPWRPGSGDGSDAFYSNDFFGGDLQGIIDKLALLRELGINTLYLNPIFKAPSNHKYDTADYHAIDPAFGNEADFRRLTSQARKLGIRVVPDTSFNHSGSDSIYFNRYGRHGTQGAFQGGKVNPASPYADWYRFDTSQSEPDQQYKGWAGPDLPEFDKSSRSFRDFAFGARDSVTRHWLDAGASGWRMDVAPWVPDDFWREWRIAVKADRPDALTVAETWFDASKFLLGDMFDSTMNYIFRNAVLDYAGGGSAKALVANLELMREAYPPQAFHALMNLISGHDSARALHVLGGQDGSDAATMALAKQRLRLAVFIQMTYPGAPTVYYGDEVGMTGGDDPYNRGTYPWHDLGGKPDLDLRDDFKRLIKLRNDHPVLRRGSLGEPLFADGHVVVLARQLGKTWALTAINNDEQSRTVSVTLPEGAAARYRNALQGGELQAQGRQIKLTVPPRFGTVLVSR